MYLDRLQGDRHSNSSVFKVPLKRPRAQVSDDGLEFGLHTSKRIKTDVEPILKAIDDMRSEHIDLIKRERLERLAFEQEMRNRLDENVKDV